MGSTGSRKRGVAAGPPVSKAAHTISSINHADADIFSRWKGGFATRGLVQLEDQFLGLFEIPSPNGELDPE